VVSRVAGARKPQNQQRLAEEDRVDPIREQFLVAESDSIRYAGSMKTRSVTDVARNFSAVLDALERDQEEVVLVRNQRQIARLVPEAPRQDALTVLGDLYRTIDDETAEALSAAIASSRKRRGGRLSELRGPWAG
jgi:antitoxin (DNA-binding transcriptional repressor) of toxin-antitoxin stability system